MPKQKNISTEDDNYCVDQEYVSDEMNPSYTEALFDEEGSAESSFSFDDDDFESKKDVYSAEIFDINPDNEISLGPQLREDTMHLLHLAQLGDDFFKTKTLDDRFLIYSSILETPDLDESSALYRFAKQAPLYDLFLYSWKIVHLYFPREQYENIRSDVEQTFMERILRVMSKGTFDPSMGKVGPYFARFIYGAVYDLLIKKSSYQMYDNDHDSRAISFLKKIRNRFNQIGENPSEGDYILEMHNTFSMNNHLSRARLHSLIVAIEQQVVELSIESDTGENGAYAPEYEDPTKRAITKLTRNSIIKVIISEADNITDAEAFIRYYYNPEDDENVSIQRITEEYYENSLNQNQVLRIFDKIKLRLKENRTFLELLGKSPGPTVDIEGALVSAVDDLSGYVISDDELKNL